MELGIGFRVTLKGDVVLSKCLCGDEFHDYSYADGRFLNLFSVYFYLIYPQNRQNLN